ncbi:GDSL-type esterase/lipase family protein [Desulfonatronum sp. SC1]|uniref:SGNH/GDSL hydrolase family protein n=1 Tax=Desulfonatronum sp. SC1 TaxID=2109626 RepID=UPI000D3188B2|nr:GDSL-type esterase/lipase family protein [Desulfonatronum sp. SC1]PTN35143.1 hypothetical protein C6366_11525 [Desulfonatronum sp. SC1]
MVQTFFKTTGLCIMKHIAWIFIFFLCCGANGYAQVNPKDAGVGVVPFTQWQKDYCADNDPNTILSIGDSITSGESVSMQYRYPFLLQALTGMQVVNQAQSGSRSTYGVYYLPTYLVWHKPRVVTILYGVNDIGERSVSDIANNLRIMVILAKNNNSFPVLATLTPIFAPRDWKAESVMELNRMIRDIVRQEGILLADLDQAFNWDSRYFPNGLHPNEAGMQIIANVFSRAIQRIPSCQAGSLLVSAEPGGARNMGAQWRRVGTETWRESGVKENDILVGTYAVEFKDVQGWTTPAEVLVQIVNGQMTSVTGVYRIKSLPGVMMLLLDEE